MTTTTTPGPTARLGPVVVAARGLTAGYGGTPAIHGIDLEARAGEVVALLGANGAGKTTTLLALAGELAPITGTIELQGDARRRRLHQRARQGLGFLTEERCVFMQLTGWQNLKLGRGRPDRALELFPELEEHLGKKVGLLSGGQQQMLSISRALMAAPQMILLDEPSLGLSPRLTREIFEIVVRINRERGTTLLLVEQNAHMALNVADYGYVLENGRIVMEDTCERLREKDDIKEFYLGMKEAGERGERRWKKKKTWR
jgi:branched-chain amino acid transport system ATP-binding protein